MRWLGQKQRRSSRPQRNIENDRGAELERLERDPETSGERGRSEPPERGIEDDEELER
jgi:hypothetical protein